MDQDSGVAPAHRRPSTTMTSTTTTTTTTHHSASRARRLPTPSLPRTQALADRGDGSYRIRASLASSGSRRGSTSAVLRALWQPGAQTASDLMNITGLTRVTVHEACADLIAEGWAQELQDQRSAGDYARGRPARRYSLAADAGVLLAVEAGTSRCTAHATDLLGRTAGSAAVRTGPGAAGRRASVTAVVSQALRAAGATHGQVLTCVVAVPAPVTSTGLVQVRSNPFWRLMDADIAAELSEHLTCAVTLVNDADAAAQAEARAGAAVGTSDHVTLLVDTGFGAGLFSGGAPLRGRWGRAGEMRWLDLIAEVQAPTGLGRLIAHWDAGLPDSPPPLDLHAPDGRGAWQLETDLTRARAVLDRAAMGSPSARGVVERAGHHLARAIAVAAGMLDPEVVVLAGRLAVHLTPLLEVVQGDVEDHIGEPGPLVVASLLGDDVVVRGAVLAALDRCLASAVGASTS